MRGHGEGALLRISSAGFEGMILGVEEKGLYNMIRLMITDSKVFLRSELSSPARPELKSAARVEAKCSTRAGGPLTLTQGLCQEDVDFPA